MIQHFIPVKPLTVNQAWQGRRFVSKKYKSFQQEMAYMLPKEKMIDGLVEVEICLLLKSILISDVDNYLKPILDCIVKKKWIEDDRKIVQLLITKIKAQNKETKEGFYVSIKEFTQKI